MIMTSILSTITLLSSSMLLAPNPMTAALSLLAMAIMTAASFATTTSTWMAIMVFLVYVAGMLVMFAYFVAITPNQQMMMSVNPILFLVIMVASASYMTFLPNPAMIDKSTKMLFFYSNNNPTTLLFLALALLLTMVVVVKISSQSKGPLRSFMSYV